MKKLWVALLLAAFSCNNNELYAQNINGGINNPGAAAGIPNLPLGVQYGGTGSTILGAALGSPTLRSPNYSDDSTRIYAVGDFWKNQNSNIWQSIAVSSGAAVWTPVSNNAAYPCDSVSSGCYSAWGSVKLVGAYSGPSMQITRASDSATSDLAFVNNVADYISGDIFCLGTTCTVSRLYNQTSSASTNDCIPSSASAAPPYPTTTIYGNIRPILFNGNYRLQQGSSIGAECTDGNSSLGSRSASFVFIGRPQNTGNIGMIMQMGGAGGDQLKYFYSSTLFNAINAAGGSYFTNTGKLSISPNVWGFSAGTSSTVWYNDSTAFSTTQFTNTTWTSMTVGSDPSAESSHFYLAAQIWGFMSFNSQISTTDFANIQKASYYYLPIYPQLRQLSYFTGDSLTAGWGDNTGNIWPIQLSNMLPKPTKVLSTAIGGVTCASLSNNTTHPEVKLGITQGYSPIASVWCGSNDIFGGASAATTYASLQTLIANLRTGDASAPILVPTMIDRANGSHEATRQAYNTLIRSGIVAGTLGTGPIYLVDIGGAEPLGVSGDSTNTTYFQSDQIHLTDTGDNVVASAALKVITTNGLLK